MREQYKFVYQKLQECFIVIRLLHSGVIPDDGSIENVKQSLPLIRSALEKDLSSEHMVLIYCINMLLLIMEEDERQKIFDFANLVHNMPQIGMGTRDLNSFKEEIYLFNNKYNSQYFIECLDNRMNVVGKKPALSKLGDIKMKNSKISFYGYNDGKAIEIYNCINLFLPTIISVIVALVLTILSYFFCNLYLLLIWIVPVILFLAYILCVFVTEYNDRAFLAGAKKRHSFFVDNEILLRDGKPMKTDGIKVYAFKSFVFLITKKTYYRIPNEEFVGISREDFLSFIKNAN